MKHFLPLFAIICGAFLMPAEMSAQDDVNTSDTVFVQLKDGSLYIIPRDLLADISEVDDSLVVTGVNGQTISYPLDSILFWNHQLQIKEPVITSFKFNDKFNHNLIADVDCEIVGNHISGTSPSITKWLTPSIKLSDKRAHVYTEDFTRVISKVTPVDFDRKRTLTVAYPNIKTFKEIEVKPAEIDAVDTILTAIELTEEMLSTNAPTNYPDREGLDKIIDDDPGTFFHSTWGSGAYEKLPEDQNAFIEITLPEAVHNLQYVITNRSDTGARSPRELVLQVSTDGETWEDVNIFSEENGLDTSQGATNTSEVIEFKEPYSRFRLVQTSATYKNYFCVAELKLYEVTLDEHEGTPAEYAYVLVPFGHEYEAEIDFLVDEVENVPTVSIDLNGYDYVYSKTEYIPATITIDGAGLFPSMEATPVEIKGRGNSSWSSNSYSKNPYRLKFEEKQKPLGLKKGRSWVLLSNRQRGSMLSNAIGMQVAGMAQADGANHIIPVELYMNGEYWGSYNFTEKVGLSNNSIDIEDETYACLIELDSYYDEVYKFKTKPYSIPVNVKEPDFSETTEWGWEDIKVRMDTLAYRVQKGMDIDDIVDVESMARFLMTNELILNYELMHPKSTYMYCEDVLEDTCKLKFGPVWDLDWAYGYEGAHNYYQSEATANFWSGKSMEATTFLKRLRQNTGEAVDRAMYKVWTRFMRLHFQALLDFVDEYYAYARPSLENNNNIQFSTWSWWGSQDVDKDYTDYEQNAKQARAWLAKRAPYAYAKLTPYEMSDEEIFGYSEAEGAAETDPYIIDVVKHPMLSDQPTRFNVYDLNGVLLKSGATYDTFRNGLRPGLYIVNGRKVLID
ncbi:MAG: CotH kinase family protein [Bacteroidaceae bacterium]|nr:CotH kinase family protein [Bacteroidaceae bacterium]